MHDLNNSIDVPLWLDSGVAVMKFFGNSAACHWHLENAVDLRKQGSGCRQQQSSLTGAAESAWLRILALVDFCVRFERTSVGLRKIRTDCDSMHSKQVA